ncbi:MAG TPA: cell division protein FtsQ/DivIB [Solirubrobacterales bacterium]|nr:cell division protein FtsQ/DivIB [Solirubrobacterales bacterium]
MRWLYRSVAVILTVILIAFLYQKVFGGTTVEPHLVSSEPVAVIGSGDEAVAVADDGTVLTWLALPEDVRLPQLPLGSPPKGLRVEGPVLEQVRVLAAAPAALRPYVAGSQFGESGVDVELSSGIELRFGSVSDAARKWRAAAAVLADPSITALDYVDVTAPGRPAVRGSGHTLPPIE